VLTVALAACPPSPVDVAVPVPAMVRMLHTLAGLGESEGDRELVGDSVAVPVCETRPAVHASGSHRTARTCAKRMGEGADVRQLQPPASSRAPLA
jgi:hypothetical protein